MKIRVYQPEDRAACLSIFDSNAPEYFAPTDRDEFAAFLDSPNGVYLVGEVDSKGIVACGGWYVDETQARAGLAWGMVKLALQGRGCGQLLLKERIRQIKADGRAQTIRVRTTQLVQVFFEHNGFVETRRIKDGFGEHLDFVEMELNLNK